jgi:hypothetical protein
MEPITKIQKKSMKSPNQTRSFEKGKVEIAEIGDTSIWRIHLEPGGVGRNA